MAYRYTYTVSHKGLGKQRVISGTDEGIVLAKAQAQVAEWEAKWDAVVSAQQTKQNAIDARKDKLLEAEERTKEAREAVEAVRSLLSVALGSPCIMDWVKLKKHRPFAKAMPISPKYLTFPPKPQAALSHDQPLLEEAAARDSQSTFHYPREPHPSDLRYQPDFGVLDKLVKSRAEEKTRRLKGLYISDHNAWEEAVRQVDARWDASVREIRLQNDQLYAKNVKEVDKWNLEAQEYQNELATKDATIDDLRARYETLRVDGVEDYCEMVLANSNYPDRFSPDFDHEYNPETRILIVDYALPPPDCLPTLKEVKYVKSKDDFTETFLSEVELSRLYDEALYQICLRSLHELFSADTTNALAAISFNGWVRSLDKATGKEVNACILSVQVKKEEFQAINLQNVDPKVCFKALKGVGSSKLHSLTPIAPVLTISREDRRFIASHEVADYLNDGINLAAMDWEEFEQLIRELFEKEFKQAGGEVKITQASRDGGVDAVAFDPDVIRGGKTVIQAKRYTNTVGVSAVRDLYGTVLNEGASKGILVTTSDYGPDSYSFAKGKPLVLLNGANLLNLLAKHGHKAKIDLKEAKKMLNEKG
ncbi:MAG: restriction endonuclease [Verrucomicrobiota bacterium]